MIEKDPLAIDTFWEEPPLRWEKWRTQVKLAILAKEEKNFDVLLNLNTTTEKLPSETQYEQPIYDLIEVTEGEKSHEMPNKLSWELKCQILDAGLLCCDRLWDLCDQNCISKLHLIIGTEDRRILNLKETHATINE